MPRRKAAPKSANEAANTPHEAAIAAPVEAERVPMSANNFVYDAEKHITINGKVYDRDEFAQEQVQQISTVNFADQQIMNATQLLNIQKLGRDQLVKELLEAISAVPHVAEIDMEATAAAAS